MIVSHQLRTSQDMTVHGALQIRAARSGRELQFGVQRVEVEEVTMRAAWGTRSAIGGVAEAVRSLLRPSG